MSLKEHYLYPGNLFADREPHMVTTVLGSCVSVCLFDPVRRLGGINHYMLPFWNGEGLASPKYGNIAIQKLIERMLSLGCDRRALEAKVFGGGEVLRITSGAMNVGQRNIMLAMEMLTQEKIPIKVANVGGQQGRKLYFNSGDGQVLMKRLNRIDAK
jgi:chemotaxis protein CheD